MPFNPDRIPPNQRLYLVRPVLRFGRSNSRNSGFWSTKATSPLKNTCVSLSAKTFSNMIEHKTKGIFNGMPNQNAPYCSENLIHFSLVAARIPPPTEFLNFRSPSFSKSVIFRIKNLLLGIL